MNTQTRNLGDQPHDWAMQKVKEKFGSNMGMSKSTKKTGRKDYSGKWQISTNCSNATVHATYYITTI